MTDASLFLQVWQEGQYHDVQHTESDRRDCAGCGSKLHLHPGGQVHLWLWSQRRLDEWICAA